MWSQKIENNNHQQIQMKKKGPNMVLIQKKSLSSNNFSSSMATNSCTDNNSNGNNSSNNNSNQTNSATAPTIPKYVCPSCNDIFSNWSQCLSHVRNVESVNDSELHKLTLSPEGRRELQKLCKFSDSTTPSTTPASTPRNTPTSSPRGLQSSSLGLFHHQNNNKNSPENISGNGNNNFINSIKMLQQQQQQQQTYGNLPFVQSSTSNRRHYHYPKQQQQPAHHHYQQQQQQAYYNFSPTALTHNNFSRDHDRGSVSSFSSVSISPETTPQSSPLGSPNKGPVKVNPRFTQASINKMYLAANMNPSNFYPSTKSSSSGPLNYTPLRNQNQKHMVQNTFGSFQGGRNSKHSSSRSKQSSSKKNRLELLPNQAALLICQMLPIRDTANIAEALRNIK